MFQLDYLKVNFWIFLEHFPWGVFYSRAAVEFLQLVLCEAIKTVRTMNLKFVWSELHLISVRSQVVLAFANAVEAFVNTARGLFDVNSLFIF